MANRKPMTMETKSNGVVYKTKLVKFFDRVTRIVLENGDGSSLLVSICNVLLLRGDVQLDLAMTEVSQQNLMSVVAERLLNSKQSSQKIDELMNLLPHLATGIHVNLCFRKINDYESIRERAILDILDIGLYHGWIVNPQDTDTASVIGSKSYSTILRIISYIKTRKLMRGNKSILEEDSVVFPVSVATSATTASSNHLTGQGKGDLEEEKTLLRTLKMSEKETCNPINIIIDPGDRTCEGQESDCEEEDFLPELGEEEECQLMQNFLDSCPNQLTDYGLFCLMEGLKEREHCVFFCNNHFSMMFKYNGKLYLLEADESYIDQDNLVWTDLTEINGGKVFVTGSFEEFKAEKQENLWSEEIAVADIVDQIFNLQDSESAGSSLQNDLLYALSCQLDELD